MAWAPRRSPASFGLTARSGDDAKKFLQATIEHGYDEFIGRVSSGRKKTREDVDAIAQGRVWAGVDAKRLGLVDQLGSFDDAVKSAAKRAKLEDYDLKFVEPSLSWAQQLALQVRVLGAEDAIPRSTRARNG